MPALDSTAMNAMAGASGQVREEGIQLILSHVNEQPMKVMQKCGFVERAGRERTSVPTIDAAIARAGELLSAPAARS